MPAAERRMAAAGACSRRAVAPRRVVLSSDAGQKPLTRREREVLNLISEGYSNKQGALRMQISPRTFESHRAEAMRKLGARNTADLVRAALLHPTIEAVVAADAAADRRSVALRDNLPRRLRTRASGPQHDGLASFGASERA